ncbi:MAG: TCP-1/cpn60 chaperonin family protein [Caldilineaceae bacterium]
MNKPRVIGQPATQQDILMGINMMADLLAPTLGPTGGVVASGPTAGNKVELLDDASTIVRRIISLGSQRRDIGAMVMRSLVWRVGQRAGDGGATAAVIARALYRSGIRLSNAGYNTVRMARGIERGVKIATDTLRAQAQPIASEDDLASVARTITKDDALSAVLGEMSYLLGPNAHVVIEKYVAPYLQRRYIAGAYYGAEIRSMYFYTQPDQRRALLTAPAIAIVDGRLSETEHVLPLMEAAVQQGYKGLAIVAMDVTGAALGALVANQQAPEDKKKLSTLAVKLKVVGDEYRWALTDLALLTGATVLGSNAVRTAAEARPEDLGRTQRVEFANKGVVIVAHESNREAIQTEVGQLRRYIESLPLDDEDRPKHIKRLGALTGGVGELKIGAHGKNERSVREAQAERSFKVLSAAQQGGVVAGGGAALFHCIPALQAAAATETDEHVAQGIRLLAEALAAPLEQIIVNSGRASAPKVIMQQIRDQGPTATYDALCGKVVDAFASGVLDVANVLAPMLQIAASGAMMALSTDAVVYHRKPKESLQPD